MKNSSFTRQVKVSSNCQTGGIAAALQVIFPNDEIIPLPLPNLGRAETEQQFAEKLKNIDVWVSIGQYDLLEKFGLSKHTQLVKIPIIRFSGFHPDLVYAKKLSTGEFTDPHYNSAIAVWAYKNNLCVTDAIKLFNKHTFDQLGYLNQWGPSLEQLKKRFDDSDLNFEDFILPMRREGLFMYSLNHPKAMALSRLAKLVAMKIGATAKVMDRCIDINDGLNNIIWPIYPDIGENLSLHSAYEWKIDEGKWISGLRAYLENAYANYANQQIEPEDIYSAQINEQLYDHVLGAQLRFAS